MYAEDDLVDACKPGDRVSICGIYKAVAPKPNGSINAQFRAVVVANNIKRMVRDVGESWQHAESNAVGPLPCLAAMHPQRSSARLWHNCQVHLGMAVR